MPEREPSLESEKDPREELAKEVRALFDERHFSIPPEDEALLAEQIREEERYITLVGKHQEGENVVERFLKIPVNDNPKVDEPFRRQIELSRFLKEKGHIRTRGAIEANTDRQTGTPFAIMETFAEGEAKIGFIASYEDMELLTKKEARSCIETLEKLQSIDVKSMPEGLSEILQKFDLDVEGLLKDLIGELDSKVVALDSPGQKEEPYHEILNRRLGIENFKERVAQLLEHWKEVIQKEDGKGQFMVHGDLSPTNLYVYDNGDVEFLDWEWAGVCPNKAISTIIDFGNLRARAWNNRKFREALDKELIETYKKHGQEKLGRAIVSLGILRSHMSLAGFFENYDLKKQRKEEETQRREATETDIVRAWEIAGLEF